MKKVKEIKYDDLINKYKNKYLDQYKKYEPDASDKNYFKSIFIREVIDGNKSRIYGSPKIAEAMAYRNEKLWLKSIPQSVSIAEFCKMHKLNSNEVVNKIAEYEGLALAWIEINKSNKTYDVIEPDFSKTQNSTFKLNEEVVSKIDFIRIINALWELNAFVKDNGTYPTKQNTMIAFGNILGIDLSNYDKDLSKALNNSSVEVNIEIFKKMEGKITSICADKV